MATKKTGKKKRKYTRRAVLPNASLTKEELQRLETSNAVRRRADVTPASKAAERDPMYGGHPLDHPERTIEVSLSTIGLTLPDVQEQVRQLVDIAYSRGRADALNELFARMQDKHEPEET